MSVNLLYIIFAPPITEFTMFKKLFHIRIPQLEAPFPDIKLHANDFFHLSDTLIVIIK